MNEVISGGDTQVVPRQAIILAGGGGERLRSVVSDVPKPMAPIDGHPFMEYLLHQLLAAGVDDVVVCAGYLAEQLTGYFGDGRRWGLRIHYSVETEPLGTGGAIKLAESLLMGERWLLMNGDSLFDIDLADLAAAHRRLSGLVTLAVARVTNPARFGGVTLAPDGTVAAYVEKQDPDAVRGGPGVEHGINGGIGIVDRPVLDIIPPGRPISFEREVLTRLVGHGLRGALFDAYFTDIGIPDDYRRAQLDYDVFRRLRRLTS